VHKKNVYRRVHRGHRGAHGAQENVLRVKLSGTKQLAYTTPPRKKNQKSAKIIPEIDEALVTQEVY